MNTAELAGREFDAEKWNVKLLDAQTRQVYIDTAEGDDKLKVLSEEEKVLPIPRRPQWTGLTAEQLREEENKNFLEWRRSLARYLFFLYLVFLTNKFFSVSKRIMIVLSLLMRRTWSSGDSCGELLRGVIWSSRLWTPDIPCSSDQKTWRNM
jgi:hypothetical protein